MRGGIISYGSLGCVVPRHAAVRLHVVLFNATQLIAWYTIYLLRLDVMRWSAMSMYLAAFPGVGEGSANPTGGMIQ